MKIHRDVAQGSPEWVKLRLGVLTASSADRIITKAKLAPSEQQDAYLDELVAETVLGQPCDDAKGPWMTRGTELEGEARTVFGFVREPVEQVGFISRDDGRVGCSPDGIVDGKFGAEFKCPSAVKHVGYLRRPADLVAAYRLQLQWSMWVTGWPWVIMSYCPGFSEVVVGVSPEPVVLAAFDRHVPDFLAKLDAAVAAVRGVG